VLRGASWSDRDPDYLLSSYRYSQMPDVRTDFIGFRVVLADASSR
jgi:formylglycine-generating enzyme required for sulfatase activity